MSLKDVFNTCVAEIRHHYPAAAEKITFVDMADATAQSIACDWFDAHMGLGLPRDVYAHLLIFDYACYPSLKHSGYNLVSIPTNRPVPAIALPFDDQSMMLRAIIYHEAGHALTYSVKNIHEDPVTLKIKQNKYEIAADCFMAASLWNNGMMDDEDLRDISCHRARNLLLLGDNDHMTFAALDGLRDVLAQKAAGSLSPDDIVAIARRHADTFAVDADDIVAVQRKFMPAPQNGDMLDDRIEKLLAGGITTESRLVNSALSHVFASVVRDGGLSVSFANPQGQDGQNTQHTVFPAGTAWHAIRDRIQSDKVFRKTFYA